MEETTLTESNLQNITKLPNLFFNSTISYIIERNDTIFPAIINIDDGTDFPTISNITNDTNFTTISSITNVTNSLNLNPAYDFTKYYPIMAAEMALSCLCLIFSIAVYAVLPEFKNVHGKNLISMSVSLIIAFILLIFDLLWKKVVPRSVCFYMGMVLHVTFLGNFFWTNVMAFDIWKSLTDMKEKGELKGGSAKFLKYAIYAWSMPFLITVMAAILDLTDWVNPKYRPHFGANSCWVNGYLAYRLYFFLPVGLILLCNLCLFLATLRNLRIIKRTTAMLNVRPQQKRLYLYLKLFLLTGITWTSLYLPLPLGIPFLYALSSMLTALQGVFLFVIFVCKKKILTNFFRIVLSKQIPKSSISYNPSQQTVSTSINTIISVDKLRDSKF